MVFVRDQGERKKQQERLPPAANALVVIKRFKIAGDFKLHERKCVHHATGRVCAHFRFI
jgi:hypothetical protein